MTKRFDGWSVGALVATAAAFTFGVLWVRSWQDLGPPSYDIYGFFYPNQVYAWRSLMAGRGLLWNPYQDCGQPLFALSQVGFLYPVNAVFALLEREPALLASVVINLTIAGVGALGLGRALGLDRVPALCAALAFQLGWVTTWLASWSPIHIASFAWLPVALWRTERLIVSPTRRAAIALGLVLTVQQLPGFFQIGFFTYQLVGLRLLWACVTRPGERILRLLALAGMALALPLLLAGVQILPSIEVAEESMRGFHLARAQLGPSFRMTRIPTSLTSLLILPGYAIVVFLALAALTPGGTPARWHAVAFYWPVAVLYFILGLGPGSWPYDLYERLPLGTAFRDPSRLTWVTNFAIAILAGWGCQALLDPTGRRPRAVRLAALVGAGVLLAVIAPGRLGVGDALLGGGVLAAAWLADAPRGRRGAALLLPLAIGVGCLIVGERPLPLFGLRHGDIYSANAAVFAAVRERLTPQDRVLIAGRNPDFALMPKSASLFRLPNIFDYETQAPRWYVDYFTYLRTGRRLRGLDDWYWIFGRLLNEPVQRRLFDVTAARYVIVDRELDRVEQSLGGAVRLVDQTAAVRVYENLQALARARYVPKAIVASDDDGLAQLATSPLDPNTVAWVDRAPRSGFLGASSDASGAVVIESDGPEHLVVRVQAPQRGFLFLADEYYPGWTVQVNGADAEILRADHAFRLVEVPAGESRVVFTYRPLSVRLGLLVSLLTIAIVAVLWWRGRAASSPVAAPRARAIDSTPA